MIAVTLFHPACSSGCRSLAHRRSPSAAAGARNTVRDPAGQSETRFYDRRTCHPPCGIPLRRVWLHAAGLQQMLGRNNIWPV